MNVVNRIKDIKERLGDLVYIRDCPEDVVEDFRFVIEAFFLLREMLDKIAAQNALAFLELELNKQIEDLKPKEEN